MLFTATSTTSTTTTTQPSQYPQDDALARRLLNHPHPSGLLPLGYGWPDLDSDLDEIFKHQSIASSPASTRSALSQISGPECDPSLSTFNNTVQVQASSNARQASNPSLLRGQQRDPLGNPAIINSMHGDPWLHAEVVTPRSAGTLHSASTSPYLQRAPNPQISVVDTQYDRGVDDPAYQMQKPFSSQDPSFYANYPNYTYSPAGKPRLAANESRPLSVASSVASDSPATPGIEMDDDARQRFGEPRLRHASRRISNLSSTDDSPASYAHSFPAVPKLDRTMTDVYSDELYNPNFTVAATSTAHSAVSPTNDLFTQRLQAANSHHLSATHTPISISPRDRSPFRNGSPLAPVPSHEFPVSMSTSHSPYGSAHQLRDQSKALRESEQEALDTTLSGNMTPQTISPKDAMLEFHDQEGDGSFPLFPKQDPASFDTDQANKELLRISQQFDPASIDSGALTDFMASQLQGTVQVPQQYPFIPDLQQNHNSPPSISNTSPSLESLASPSFASPQSPRRPSNTSADGGTYTCTYHGCTLRFETPALLQKHKREGHRQVHAVGARRAEGSHVPGIAAPGPVNSQAGPHRCDRINPSTGKPCHTVFSRPYDLTRHEDTIHNARKQKVRCDLCTDEKSFSRADALTRHYRVCHPDVEFNGKHGRRSSHAT